MMTSLAVCYGRLADLSQKIRERLLNADRSASGVAARERHGGIAVALKNEQRRDGGAEVLHQGSLSAKHRAHRGVRATDRLVVNGETVFDPGHVHRFALHALGLQPFDELKRARVIAGEGLTRLLGAAVVELQALWTFRAGGRSR